jgi:hypothetical protein
MYQVYVVASWLAAGGGKPRRPRISDDYPQASWDDVTEPQPTIPPSPNAVMLRVRCDAATLAALQVDADYVVLDVEDEDGETG